MRRRIAIRGVIFLDGKLFCVKQTGYRNGIPNDFWCTPGGGLDESESLLTCMEREMIEETGVKPDIGTLLYIQQFAEKDEEQMEFFFHVRNSADYMNIDLSATTHGVEEIAEFAFIEPKAEYILPKFLTERDIQADIEQGQTQIFNYL